MSVIRSFSAAAFEMAASTIGLQKEVTLQDVNMDPVHTGFLRYAILMGARIHLLDQRWVGDVPVSNLRIQPAKQLQAITVRREHVQTLFTDLPPLAMLAVCAKGTSMVEGLNDAPLDGLIACLTEVGIAVTYQAGTLTLPGEGRDGLKAAKAILMRFKEFAQ